MTIAFRAFKAYNARFGTVDDQTQCFHTDIPKQKKSKPETERASLRFRASYG